MNAIQIIKNGIVKENPTFVLMLGMCPTLATTTSAMNGMSMRTQPLQWSPMPWPSSTATP